jgi:hypothetical protein
MEFQNIEYNFNISDMFIGDDTQLEFNLIDFGGVVEEDSNSKFIKPKIYKLKSKVDYKKAKDLAKSIKIEKGDNLNFIVKGDFIFGDFIEAFLVEKNLFAEECYISSLSMSQNNIDSLSGLLKDEYMGSLTMLISNYFYSHERNRLIKYYKEKVLEQPKTDLLVVRNHTKIVLMKIANFYIVISGSANLRSSNCIEQFTITESEELYNFYKEWFESLRENYSILKK